MPAPLWVVSAARFELPDSFAIPVVPVGIGLLPAMAGLADYLQQQKPPEAIILAGTAGVLLSEELVEPLPLPPVLCNRFTYPRYSFEEIPEVITVSKQTGGYPPLDALVAPNTSVYSTFGVTLNPSVMEFHTSKGRLLENLEALGLAELCCRYNIPFYALLSVTNQVGARGREQWRQNYRQAGELLAFSLQQLFAGL